MDTAFWPFMVYSGMVLFLVVAMVVISFFLGERYAGRATVDPYEAGMVATGTARVRLSVKFYLVALFFVIFDVEVIFIFAWAIAFRQVGWVAYLEILFFIGVLVAAWIYLWRLGALDWGTVWLQRQRQKMLHAPHEKEIGEPGIGEKTARRTNI